MGKNTHSFTNNGKKPVLVLEVPSFVDSDSINIFSAKMIMRWIVFFAEKIVFGQTTGGGEQPCQTTLSPVLLSPR